MSSGSNYRKTVQSIRRGLGKQQFLLAAAGAVATMWAPGAFAQVGTSNQIGIDFSTGRGENNNLGPTEVAGANTYRQNNWNMITGNVNNVGVNQGFTVVNPTSGVTRTDTLTIWWGSPNSWSISGTAPTTADGRLMNGYLDSNASGAPGNDLTNAASQPYVAISGLSGEFLNGYKVIVYGDGDDAGGGRIGQYWVTSFNSGNPANVGTETELTPRVFMRDSSNFNGTYVQTPLSSNTGAGAVAGNYIVFDGLNSPNFVLRADEFATRSSINAIQIIASPTLPTDNTEWGLSGGGAWPNAGSWLGPVPDGTSYSANFLGKATGPAAVTLNNNVQVKKMTFNNTNPYTISGSGSILVNPNSGLGSVTVVSGNHTINVPITVATTTSFDVATGASLTVNTLDAGANLVSKESGGTMVLNNAAKWGAFSVNNGTLRLGNVDVLRAGPLNGGATGTVDMNGFNQSSPRLEGAVNITNSKANNVTLALNPIGADQHFNTGAITGNITITIQGEGIQGLGGATASTYTGTTTVGDFTVLRTTSNTALGSTNAATILRQGSILQIWNSDLGFEPIVIDGGAGRVQLQDRGIIRGPITYAGGHVDLNVDANSGVANSSIQLLGDISGPITVAKLGSANGLVLGGHNTFTGGLNINQGWLGIAGNSDAIAGPLGPAGTVLNMFDGGIRSIGGNHTINNPVKIIASAAGVTVDPDPLGGTNVGVLTLTGNVDLSDTSGNPHVVTITTNADIVFNGKVSSGGIIKAGNGTLVLGNTTNDFNQGLQLLGGKVSISQNSNLGPAGQNIFFGGGLIQVTGTTVTNLDSREAQINYGSFSGGFDIADAANTFTVRANVAGSGFFRKDGAGTLLLTGSNSYTGGTIVNGGILRPSVSGALPDNSAMTINGGLMDLNGFSKTFTSLNGTGGALGNSTATNIGVTVGGNNANGAFGGAIQNGPGAGLTSLIKTGTGTQILSGASTYTGATAVNGGTLEVDGSLGNTAVTVANNGTLSGFGSVAGAVTVQSGGTIAPLAGVLSVGALTLNAGSKLSFPVGASSTSGLVNVSTPNALTLNGGAISLVQAIGGIGSQYDLIRYSGTHGGTIANLSLATPNIGDTTFTLFDDPGRAIGIVVGTSLLTWSGSANGNWDTASANWTGGATVFANGRNVRFDDSGTATTVNVAANVTPGRLDLFNDTKDYTFTGGSIGGTGGTVLKTGRGKAIFNQALTHTGATTINGGVVQLQGTSTMNATSGITIDMQSAKIPDAVGPIGTGAPTGGASTALLGYAHGGTLVLGDDSVTNRLGAAPVTLNNGTLIAAKGATAGSNTAGVTVQTVNSGVGMGRVVVAPNGGQFNLNIGSLNRPAAGTGTVDFRSTGTSIANLGDVDQGAIKLTQLNGAAFSSANLNNGLIGAWATVGDNFASYDNTKGVIANTTNVTNTLADGPNNNVRLNGTGAVSVSGSMTINSLTAGGDITLSSGSTLTVNSGALMMNGPNKWWQGNGSFLRAGSGVSQMVFTVLDAASGTNGNDHRVRQTIQDNGVPLTFIKNGEGYLNLEPLNANGAASSNTYSGPTIVNAGTLAIRTAGALGSGTAAVTVRPGATFDLGGQNIGTREVIISGNGASGTNGIAVGALTNTFADQTNAVINLTLAGDASIGGSNRFDLRTQGTNLAVLNGGTFTLTKTSGNYVAVVAPGTITVGNIVVAGGTLSFENGNNIMGSTQFTATVNSGAILQFWNNLGGAGESQNKPIVLNGGIVTSENGPTTLTGPMFVNGTGSTLRANNLLTITNVIAGSGGFNVAGGTAPATNTMLLSANNTYSGPTIINGAIFRVTGSVANSALTVNNTGTYQAPVTQKVKGLTVNTGGSVQVQPPTVAGARNVLTVGDGTSATSPFSIPGTGTAAGRVELDRNGMIVDVASGGEVSAQTSLRAAIGNAYNGGLWNQPGLTSNQITTTNKLALGYATPVDAPGAVPGGLLYGVPADASSVVVRTTVQGDSNLDGLVNFADLLSLARNYNATNTFWSKGDFDYNGLVNFNDLLILARNYNLAAPAEVPGASAAFEADMAAAFAAAVPEPTSIGLLGLAGAAMLGGRRRRRTASMN